MPDRITPNFDDIFLKHATTRKFIDDYSQVSVYLSICFFGNIILPYDIVLVFNNIFLIEV